MSKKMKNLTKIVNIDKESLYICRATWEISKKYPGEMCLMIILKVTKRQGFTFCLKNTVYKKPQKRSNLLHPTSLYAWKTWDATQIIYNHGEFHYLLR